MAERLPNRYGSAFVDKTDEEDAADWKTWLELSEEEQDRELDAAVREHNEWWGTLTESEQYAISRRSSLRSCISSRHLMKQTGLTMFTGNLRSAQKRLLKLRMSHYHGMEVSDA